MSVPVCSCQHRGYIWKVIWVLHLTSDICPFIWQVVGGISDTWSGYFISHLIVVTSSDKFWGVYLIAYLGTSSENVNSHLTFVTSSDKYWGVYLIAYLGNSSENVNSHLTFVTSCDKYWGGVYLDLVEHFIWKLDLILLSVLNGLSLTT